MSDPTRLEAASYRAVGAGTIAALHKAVKGRMNEIVAPFWTLETKTGDERAPTIGDFQLPPKTTSGADAEQFPFVLVRPRKGTDSEQQAAQNSTATVELIIGVLSDTNDGWLDAVQIIDAIRKSLGEAPVIAGTPFEHTGQLDWDVAPEEQARPQWLARVTTIWTIPRPRRAPTED